MTRDAAGNDLQKVFVPITGYLGYGPQGTTVPTPAELAAAQFTLPPTVRKVGLIKQDGGFEWTTDTQGDATEFWQIGYKKASGQVQAKLKVTLAQTDPIVRELVWGKVPDEHGVIDVDLGGNDKTYFLPTEEVSKDGIIRRRIAPSCTVLTVKEQKSERGVAQGYEVEFETNFDPGISAHFREAVIYPSPTEEESGS